MPDKMDIHTWFNLTYSSYLVIPRLFLSSMPLEWQYKFVELIDEIPNTLEIDPNYSSEYTVNCTRNGKFVKDTYRDYRRGKVDLKIK